MDTEKEDVPESTIERFGDRLATRLGALCAKGNTRGRSGWPDKFYFFPRGRVLAVEYKRRGEEAEPHQDLIHRRLRRRGYEVVVVEARFQARRVIQDFARGIEVDPEAAGKARRKATRPALLPRSRNPRDAGQARLRLVPRSGPR